MNLEKFKKNLINFIMKKWTCPVICGICVILIFVMSANSFAKYYTKVQEERAASVAIYTSNVGVDEQFWDKGYTNPSGFNGYHIDGSIDKSNIANGCVRVFMTEDIATASEYLPYVDTTGTLPNRACQISATNSANGKVCEVALKYTITIEFPQEMPKGITWWLKDLSGNAITPAVTYEKITYGSSDYYKVGYICKSDAFTFPAGVAEVDTYLIEFVEKADFVHAESTDRFYDDIRLSIQATQVTQ